MKQFTVVFAFLLCNLSVVAQQLITVQHNGTSAFYATFLEAYTNSQSGDTIYIPGGAYLAGFQISKEVHIVGVGHDPDFTAATDLTTLSNGLYFINGSNNSSVTGLVVPEVSIDYDLGPSNYIHVSRCRITSVLIFSPASNNTFKECIIDNVLGYVGSETYYPINNAFLNNIITVQLKYFGLNNLIRNNIFIGNGCCTSFNAPIFSVSQSIVENNIFCTTSAINFGTPQCIFKNNMTSGSIGCGADNICSGNISNVPLSSIFNSYDGSGFNYNFDFQLQMGNPGNNSGTDGTDIGIYGGDFPWKEGSIPFNPHVKLKTISTKTNSSGNISVNITVEAQEE